MEYTSPEDLRKATEEAKRILRGQTTSTPSGTSPTPTSPLDSDVSKLLQSGKAKTVSEARAIISYQKAGFNVERIGDKLIAYPKGTQLYSTAEGIEARPIEQVSQPQQPYVFGQTSPYGYSRPREEMQRQPSSTIEVGSQISQSAVSKLAEKYFLREGEVGIGITEEGDFSILFFDERSYDPSMVLEEYKQLESMEILRSEELAKTETPG